ncbi:prolycopene isomerase [Pycnococcus provasolii]
MMAPACIGIGAAPRARAPRARGAGARVADVKTVRSSSGEGNGGGDASSASADVVVIGAGIGGLSAASLLAKYGKKVIVCESHTEPGGAAHAWHRDGYTFESGPSLYSTMTDKYSMNPMGQVLDAIGEQENLKVVRYNEWMCHFPEPMGTFCMQLGNDSFQNKLREAFDEDAAQQFLELRRKMQPLARAAMALPVPAVRTDGAVLFTMARFLPNLLSTLPEAGKWLSRPYSEVMTDMQINNKFLRDWLDLCCFMLSGAPATMTPATEIGFMFDDWYREDATLEFPVGGSGALIDRLVAGLEKFGGELRLGAHVENVIVENDKAVGIRMRNGDVIRAETVISNASLWDTVPLVPEGALPKEWVDESLATEQCESFLHLHLGIDATGLPDDLQMHHMVVRDWDAGVDAQQNVALVSIPSVVSPDMAPPGKHVIHAYLPGTEPYDIWEGMDRRSDEYKALKKERAEVLFQAVEKAIPDVRSRIEVEMIGTPLTCARFLRRNRGTYGGRGWIKDGQDGVVNLEVNTPLDGLLCVGDSRFPGPGVPAVAAGGMVAAHSLVGALEQAKTIDRVCK